MTNMSYFPGTSDRTVKSVGFALSFMLFYSFATEAVPAKSEAVAKKAAPVKTKPSQAETKAAPPFVSGVIVEKIRSAKIFPADYPIRVAIPGNEVEIVTMKHPKSTDQDCKIDAVLAAKEIIDTYGKQASRVKLILSDSKSGEMNEITVTAGDVQAYASGSIDRDTLLGSLEIRPAEHDGDSRAAKTSGAGANAAVVEGPFQTRRSLVAERIAKLESSGTDTKPFRALFADIENRASTNLGNAEKAKLFLDIAQLNNHLAEQEELIEQAHNVEKGIGSPISRSERFNQSFQGGGGKPGGSGFQGGGGLRAHSLFGQVQNRISELKNQGKLSNADMEQFKRITDLFASRNFQDGHKQLEDLSHRLGIELPKRN